MKTHKHTVNRIFRSLSRAFYTGGVAFLIASLVLNFIPMKPVMAGNGAGSIWTTVEPCNVADGAAQDANHYAVGDSVNLRGSNLLANTLYYVTVTGNPGGSSGDPQTVVANVPITTDGEGYFCFVPYTVQPDDWGEYTVDLWLNGEKTGKNDNYRVEGDPTVYLSVSKTAIPTYAKTYAWTIAKAVDKASHTLLLGESATSIYTVTISRTLTETWGVTGTITITNPSSKYSVTLTSVTDSFNGVPATVNCPASSIGKGGQLTCTYTISGTGVPVNGNNIATVTTSAESPVQGASSPSVPVVFPAPTVSGHENVTVTDSWKGALTFTGGVATYSRIFSCPSDLAAVGTTNYPNTATIDQTGQSDSANVSVTCNAHPSLVVSKTAAASFDRKYDWTITKSVTPAVHNLMDGGSGTSNYTVALDQTVTDVNILVSGTITINNPATIPATITAVTDSMAPADCGVTFPYQLAAGATLNCTYAAHPATIANGTNNVTVTTSGLVGGGSASAAVTFGAPANTIGYPTINVTDSVQPGTQSFSADGTWQYSRDFTCDLAGSQGNTSTEYPNVATITETGQNDNALVTVNCSAYAPLTIGKTAVTSYTRTHTWTIDKSVDVAVHNLLVGQSAPSTYTVALVKTTVDSGFKVEGEITITNTAQIAATLTGVTDSLASAVVTCPVSFPYSLAAGGSLKCAYTAPLLNANATSNTATVATSGLILGSTSAPVAVTFGLPTVVGFDSVTVSDPMVEGVFGPYNASTSFTYPHTFTCVDPITDTIDNTATIVETGAFDSAVVALNCAAVPTPTPTPGPTNTPTPPVVTPTDDPGTSTPIPTLPQPPSSTQAVLIPVTGADLSMPAPLANLQTVFGRLGLALLGIGLVLQGLSRKLEE